MYEYNDIKTLHIEITSRCQAKCPMCARNYHGGVSNSLLPITDLNFFKQACSVDFLQNLNCISLGGNFGDPILHLELLSIIEYIVQSNPNIFVEIHTNGSARTKQWWSDLARTLPNNHIVEFGIDGLEDTHSIYRINTDYNLIISNATTFIKAGGNARWNFIVFKHNEHQLEQARQIATELGFHSFYEKQSSRFIGSSFFNVVDKQGDVIYTLEQPTNSKLSYVDVEVVKNYKQHINNVEISCQVENTSSIYIDAQGQLWPCCFTAAIPYLFAYPTDLVYEYITESKNQLNELFKLFGGQQNLNLKNRTIREIVNSEEWQTLWDQHFSQLNVCARICGKIPKDKLSQCLDQYLDLKKLND